MHLAVIALATSLLQPAEPQWTLEDDILTVTLTSWAHVSNADANTGGQVELLEGDMIGDPSMSFTSLMDDRIVWRLPPGEYNLRAFSMMDEDGHAAKYDYTVVVPAVERSEAIREAVVNYLMARDALRDLNPTGDEFV